MRDVITLLIPISAKWYLIGSSLEVNTDQLDSLMMTNKSADMNLANVINKNGYRRNQMKPHGKHY